VTKLNIPLDGKLLRFGDKMHALYGSDKNEIKLITRIFSNNNLIEYAVA